MFIIILIGTIIIQLVMVKFGGKSLKTIELSATENMLCIVLGASSLLAGLFIKAVFPENLIICPQGVEIGEWKYYWSKVPEKEE